MNEVTEKPQDTMEAVASAPESRDPAYLSWVQRKIERGLEGLKAPENWHSEKDIWKVLGAED